MTAFHQPVRHVTEFGLKLREKIGYWLYQENGASFLDSEYVIFQFGTVMSPDNKHFDVHGNISWKTRAKYLATDEDRKRYPR